MDMEKLENLENKIEDMLALHTAVCEERDRLRQELGEAQARLQRQDKERSEVKEKVERILGRLDSLHLT